MNSVERFNKPDCHSFCSFISDNFSHFKWEKLSLIKEQNEWLFAILGPLHLDYTTLIVFKWPNVFVPILNLIFNFCLFSLIITSPFFLHYRISALRNISQRANPLFSSSFLIIRNFIFSLQRLKYWQTSFFFFCFFFFSVNFLYLHFHVKWLSFFCFFFSSR